MVISENMRDKATLYFWQLFILTDIYTHTSKLIYINKALNI